MEGIFDIFKEKNLKTFKKIYFTKKYLHIFCDYDLTKQYI